MRYPNASTEPLEIIRANECDAEPGLATARFQALWNEIERLKDLLQGNIKSSSAAKEFWTRGL